VDQGHKPLGEKPSKVAIIALCLSIGTAAFSIYQWWSGQRASRIAAAVGISNRYIYPYDLGERMYEERQSASPDDMRRFEAYSNRLEYIAFLANRDLIDADYIPQILQCDILFTSGIIKHLQKDRKVQVAMLSPNLEMEAFTRRLRGPLPCFLPPASGL
jgi:hypothetical protein